VRLHVHEVPTFAENIEGGDDSGGFFIISEEISAAGRETIRIMFSDQLESVAGYDQAIRRHSVRLIIHGVAHSED